MINLYIVNGETLYKPILKGDVSLTEERKGVCGTLKFTVVKDDVINFQEGNAVELFNDEVLRFYGFVFKKQRNKDGTIQVTAYDQLRYFKNKDTYTYNCKTSELLKMIAEDFQLECGSVEDTEYTIPARIEDNSTLFDIMQTSLELTLVETNKMYVLYDDAGKLTLNSIDKMKLDLVITKEVIENYDYTSSIDDDTYNQVKLVYENDSAGTRDVYMSKDSSNINQWGILQYYDTIEEGEDGASKADKLLSLYNQKSRSLKITNALGDIRVRGGSMLIVNLSLGDVVVSNYMIVEKVDHKFEGSKHTMDLTLKGGVINA